MKVLFVTPYLPGPPIFGGQRRIFGLLTGLAQSHEVSVVSLVDATLDPTEAIRDTRRYCRHVVAVPDAWHRVSGRRKRLLQLGSLLSTRSWERLLHHRAAFQRALDRHLAEHRYDVISCEFAFMAAYRFDVGAADSQRARLVLDEHNIEYDLARRTASATTLGRRLFSTVNWRKLKREEVAAWCGFDGCTVTSKRDQECVLREAPMARTAVIPNGVDLDAFQPRPGVSPEPGTVLFFGAMNYYPNTDGALFFVREVLPLLRARHPRVRLRIVGPVGPGPVMDLAADGVEIVGFVEDLPSEIARAAVVVAPLRIGGGTRLKILEAMAMARPIVSTRVGAEGLDVVHERELLCADAPDAFADAVARVLADTALATRLGQAARALVEARYGWNAAASELASFYFSLLPSNAIQRGSGRSLPGDDLASHG